jgi:precorrin-8X/cobalt-precorrin-8 methylmutase
MTGREAHPIEVRSYRILRERVDTAALAPLRRAVVERVIHASADPGYLHDLVLAEETALASAAAALAGGVGVGCDSRMVAAAVTSRPVICGLALPATAEASGGAAGQGTAEASGGTRSAAGIRAAFAAVGPRAVWVIGTAPTALAQLLALPADPLLVIGLPVGFVGAVEAKAALRERGWPAVSNLSEKGGAGVAAAALNALLYAGRR